jgi:hypothetical protein
MQRERLQANQGHALAFRIKPIAKALGLPLQTIYYWTHSVVNPLPTKTVGSSKFVIEKDLREYLLRNDRMAHLELWDNNREDAVGKDNSIRVDYLLAIENQDADDMRSEWQKEIKRVQEAERA